MYFSKKHPIGFRWSVIIEKHILSSESPKVAIHRCKNLLNGGELYEIYFLGIRKNI